MQEFANEHNLNIKTVIQAPVEGSSAPTPEDNYPKPDQNKTERKPGFRGFVESKVGKGVLVASGLLAAGGLIFGVKSLPVFGETGHSPAATSAPNPESTPAIPAEAKTFIEADGSLYTQPLATYYAEKAYETAHPELGGLPLTPDFVSSYNFDSQPFENGATSTLGFSVESIPQGQEVNVDNSIATFNASVPNLNRLMNLLAKNPSQDRINVIKDDFSKSSGLGNPEASKLVDTLLTITQKYGSNANYTLNQAQKGEYGTTSNDASLFTYDQETIDAVDVNNNVTAYSDKVNLSIMVDSFNEKGEKIHQTDTSLQDVQFSVRRALDYDPGNGGFIGIGLK